MAPLSLSKHALMRALVGWGVLSLLLSPHEFSTVDAFGVPNFKFFKSLKLIPRSSSQQQQQQQQQRHDAMSLQMIPPSSSGSEGVNYGFNGGGWPQYDLSATPEEVAAAEKALQAEFEAAANANNNDPFASNMEIGNATPEQVAQAQAALDAELAAVRGDLDTTTSTAPAAWQKKDEKKDAAQSQTQPQFGSTISQQGMPSPPAAYSSGKSSPFPPPKTQQAFYASTETEKGKAKAMAAIESAVGSNNKSDELPKPAFPGASSAGTNTRPFPSRSASSPALSMARAGSTGTATPALQNAATANLNGISQAGGGKAINGNQQQQSPPPFPKPNGRMASAASASAVGSSNNPNGVGGGTTTVNPFETKKNGSSLEKTNTPLPNGLNCKKEGGIAGDSFRIKSSAIMDDVKEINKGKPLSPPTRNNNNNMDSNNSKSADDITINAAEGKIPWYGQRASASTMKPPSSLMSGSKPPASLSKVPPKVNVPASTQSTTTTTSNAATAFPPSSSSSSSSAPSTTTNGATEESSTAEANTNSGFSFSFSDLMPTYRDDATTTDATETQSSSSTGSFGQQQQPYAQSTATNSQYSFGSSSSNSVADPASTTTFDPVPPQSEPPRNNLFGAFGNNQQQQEEEWTEEQEEGPNPLERIWLNTLNQKQRVMLNKAAVRTVEYSLPVTAATAYLLSNNAEPLRNAQSAAEYVANTAVPNAYQEWISEDKVRGLTMEKNTMTQYMDRMNAPWVVEGATGALGKSPEVQHQQQQEEQPQAGAISTDSTDAPANYEDYLKWRAEQEALEGQSSQQQTPSSVADPDAAAAAGVSSILNQGASEPQQKQQQPQPSEPTYADQMWNRAMSVPAAPSQPQTQKLQSQAPSHADQLWDRVLSVPPAQAAPQQQKELQQQQQPSLADQMWDRAMTVPPAVPQAEPDQNFNVPQQDAAPSMADQMWDRAMMVPPAVPPTEPEQVLPQQETTPSIADQLWNRAMAAVPHATPGAATATPENPSGPSFADNLWQRFHSNPETQSAEPEAVAQAPSDDDVSADEGGGFQQQQQEPSYDETVSEETSSSPMIAQQETAPSVSFETATAEGSWSTEEAQGESTGSSAAFDDTVSQPEEPMLAYGEDQGMAPSSEFSEQKQQFSRYLEAMKDEVSRRMNGPDTPDGTMTEEEVTPVMWSENDYYRYRDDSLF